MLEIKKDKAWKQKVHYSITKKHREIGIKDQNLSDKIYKQCINIHQDYTKGLLHFIAFREITFKNPNTVKYFYQTGIISKIILNALLEASVLCVRRLTDEKKRNKPNSIFQLHEKAVHIQNIGPNKRKEVQEWIKKLEEKRREIKGKNLFKSIKDFTDKVISHNDPDFYENDVSIACTNIEEAYILIHKYIQIFTGFYSNDLQNSIVFLKHIEEIVRDYEGTKNALTEKIVHSDFESNCKHFLWSFYTAKKIGKIKEIIHDNVDWNSKNHELPHNSTHKILKIILETANKTNS